MPLPRAQTQERTPHERPSSGRGPGSPAPGRNLPRPEASIRRSGARGFPVIARFRQFPPKERRAPMSDQTLYRWLEQQGEAFGSPGLTPRWTSSVKDAIGTAYSASSRIWFTCSHGILNEIYHPTIDRAQVRDMEFLITDGETFVHEEKRDLESEFAYIDP